MDKRNVAFSPNNLEISQTETAKNLYYGHVETGGQ